MARGIVLLAILAAGLTFAAGFAAAFARLAAVRAAFDAQVALAHTLIGGASDRAPDLERALERDGLHVIVEDHVNNVVYDWRDGSLEQHSIPPVPAGAPFPGLDGVPAPPLPRPNSPIDRLVGLAFGRAPQRIAGENGIAAVIAPNLPALVRFLIGDAIVTAISIVAIVAGAVWILTGLARAARKDLEAMLEERRTAAEEYQRFLADAGHELRTPLTIVSGYVDILARDLRSSEHGAQILEGMRGETARMRALVEKMLLLARLDSPLSIPRLVDVAGVASDVVAQMRARYPERELVLRAQQGASIVIDQDDLYEALRNLVENALRYAPRSPVEIVAAASASNAEIAITDRGEGIAPEEREKVFERFYRGTSRTDGEGSGLGLAIVKRVAERWSGAIALQSRPGETIFTLRFPLAEEEHA
ncbi:MAG TPA: HAMP domain-containing sensor histidine kinase [Candidatus Acidoferrales bacterium]|nr:HAMP domain-containing sensor histidine kinase [Candidatus Acidoferrales bacterium]